MARHRFVEGTGGTIVDRFTGIAIAKVEVLNLDTTTAQRVVTTIIDALHAEFGPRSVLEVKA